MHYENEDLRDAIEAYPGMHVEYMFRTDNTGRLHIGIEPETEAALKYFLRCNYRMFDSMGGVSGSWEMLVVNGDYFYSREPRDKTDHNLSYCIRFKRDAKETDEQLGSLIDTLDLERRTHGGEFRDEYYRWYKEEVA